jgi:hypothetical protein
MRRLDRVVTAEVIVSDPSDREVRATSCATVLDKQVTVISMT